MTPLDPFDAPQPGESLTSNPEQKYPFEKPPQLNEESEAIEEMYLRITEEETLDQLLDLMREGMPVEEIAQVILFEGFRSGAYNPDLMLMLIEPTIYILLAMADYAEVPAVLYPEDDFDIDPAEGGMKSITSINQLLERKRMGESAEGETPAIQQDDSISVGEQTFERPEAITPSMLDTIRSKVGGTEDVA